MKSSIKNISSSALVLAVALGLGGCAGMSRQGNTAVGAAVGGVAGSVLTGGSVGGAIGGAVVGGVIGNQSDRGRGR